ncbi:MAG: hypothetical protein K2X66_02385 [Cyanobacteria bacterium]|nr:hypothetical protein [Cyanobacteriota bacterium]
MSTLIPESLSPESIASESNLMKDEKKYIYLCPIGSNDPWSKSQKEKEWPQKNENTIYGAALSILEKYRNEIEEAVFLVTTGMFQQLPVLEAEMKSVFPDVKYTVERIESDNPTHFEEVERCFRPVLDKYRDRSGANFIINSASSTPQIINYLSTLYYIEYFGKPSDQACLAYAHSPFEYKGLPEDRITLEDKRHEPMKVLFDSYQLASLINEFDYAAALRLIEKDQKLSHLRDPILFLRDLLNLQLHSIFMQKIKFEKPIEIKNKNIQKLVQTYFSDFIQSQKENESAIFLSIAVYYWSMLVKLHRNEWVDFILRASVLREFILNHTVLAMPELKGIVQKKDTGFHKLDFSKFNKDQQNQYIRIGISVFRNKYLKNSPKTLKQNTSFELDVSKTENLQTYGFVIPKDNELINLQDLSCRILLELFSHPMVDIAKSTKDFVDIRNDIVHKVQILKENQVIKIQDWKPLLKDLMIEFSKSNMKSSLLPLWDMNFFEKANELILEESKLDWLVRK